MHGNWYRLITMQCRKKTKITHIKDWLEKEYPNRFDVHIKRPFTLLNSTEFDQSYSDRDVVNIKFPFVYQLLNEDKKDSMQYVDVYISMDYRMEEKVFKQIKLVK